MALTYSKPDYLEKIIAQYKLEKFDNVSRFSKTNIKRFQGLIDDIEKWRDNNILKSQEAIKGNLMEILETKITESAEIGLEKDNAGKEMVLKIETILAEIPVEKREKMLDVFNSYSIERLYHFLEEKSTEEAIVFFKEFAGK